MCLVIILYGTITKKELDFNTDDKQTFKILNFINNNLCKYRTTQNRQ